MNTHDMFNCIHLLITWAPLPMLHLHFFTKHSPFAHGSCAIYGFLSLRSLLPLWMGFELMVLWCTFARICITTMLMSQVIGIVVMHILAKVHDKPWYVHRFVNYSKVSIPVSQQKPFFAVYTHLLITWVPPPMLHLHFLPSAALLCIVFGQFMELCYWGFFFHCGWGSNSSFHDALLLEYA